MEVYDTNTGALAELTNSSTRGLVGTGQNVIIAGFITNGSTQVVVRGLGPTLTQFGVSEALADPVVSLFDGNGNVVQTNNNWKDTQQAEIQATGWRRRMTWRRRSLHQSRPETIPLFFRATVVGRG